MKYLIFLMLTLFVTYSLLSQTFENPISVIHTNDINEKTFIHYIYDNSLITEIAYTDALNKFLFSFSFKYENNKLIKITIKNSKQLNTYDFDYFKNTITANNDGAIFTQDLRYSKYDSYLLFKFANYSNDGKTIIDESSYYYNKNQNKITIEIQAPSPYKMKLENNEGYIMDNSKIVSKMTYDNSGYTIKDINLNVLEIFSVKEMNSSGNLVYTLK